MSDHEPAPAHADAADEAHDAGHHDEHGHAADTLGPVDWRMWGAGVLGVLAAAAVLVGFGIATRFNVLDLVRLG